ncbi:unnamed protein product [Phytophthora fragariaefolia]|uniref:Unnamed protein product n=1 Tax=Phytophthora fragariaefolia TaxID=1490495 RepID=A0A9W7CH38_9STRA|nr:unnamed protein product [Phytophthora fragariaefolia]
MELDATEQCEPGQEATVLAGSEVAPKREEYGKDIEDRPYPLDEVEIRKRAKKNAEAQTDPSPDEFAAYLDVPTKVLERTWEASPPKLESPEYWQEWYCEMLEKSEEAKCVWVGRCARLRTVKSLLSCVTRPRTSARYGKERWWCAHRGGAGIVVCILAEGGVMKAEIQRYLELKLIIPSSSPWASPVLMIRRPDGRIKFCIDYQKLNAVTVKDCYPMPLIDDIMDILGGAQLFSSMNIASGYWNVPCTLTACLKRRLRVSMVLMIGWLCLLTSAMWFLLLNG